MKDIARSFCNNDRLRIPRTAWHGEERDLQAAIALLAEGDWVLKPDNLGGGVAHFLSKESGSPSIPRSFFHEVAEQQRAFEVLAPVAWRGSKFRYIIEQRIGDKATTLNDYKVHVFSGIPRILSVYADRQAGLSVSHFSLPNADELLFQRGPNPPTTTGLAEDDIRALEDLATEMAPPTPYMRIDYYVENGQVWFGEYSPFGNIEGLASRPDLDRVLGSWWTNREDEG